LGKNQPGSCGGGKKTGLAENQSENDQRKTMKVCQKSAGVGRSHRREGKKENEGSFCGSMSIKSYLDSVASWEGEQSRKGEGSEKGVTRGKLTVPRTRGQRSITGKREKIRRKKKGQGKYRFKPDCGTCGITKKRVGPECGFCCARD